MAERNRTRRTEGADANADKGTGPGDAQVQEKVDAETERGFRGLEVDKTPNENYTLAGQNAGKPVPETDTDAADAARAGQTEVQSQATGVAER